MSNVKKVFAPVFEILNENQNVKVKDLMPQLEPLMTMKTARIAGASALMSGDKVVGMRCLYYKRWMPVVGEHAVEFGIKKGTTTGLNSMSKEGLKLWSRQQSKARQELDGLLDKLSNGELQLENLADEKARIEAERTSNEATDLGYETKEELIAALQNEGFTVDQ